MGMQLFRNPPGRERAFSQELKKQKGGEQADRHPFMDLPHHLADYRAADPIPIADLTDIPDLNRYYLLKGLPDVRDL
jgi:hypothetical protein